MWIICWSLYCWDAADRWAAPASKELKMQAGSSHTNSAHTHWLTPMEMGNAIVHVKCLKVTNVHSQSMSIFHSCHRCTISFIRHTAYFNVLSHFQTYFSWTYYSCTSFAGQCQGFRGPGAGGSWTTTRMTQWCRSLWISRARIWHFRAWQLLFMGRTGSTWTPEDEESWVASVAGWSNEEYYSWMPNIWMDTVTESQSFWHIFNVIRFGSGRVRRLACKMLLNACSSNLLLSCMTLQ